MKNMIFCIYDNIKEITHQNHMYIQIAAKICYMSWKETTTFMLKLKFSAVLKFANFEVYEIFIFGKEVPEPNGPEKI